MRKTYTIIMQQNLLETQNKNDGRVARRENNLNLVLNVVIEMFKEEFLLPSIDEVAKRSGLSLRTLYRYFADPNELAEAAIEREFKQNRALTHLPSIGNGHLNKRIEDFVVMRLKVYENAHSVFRAALHNALRNQRISEMLAERQCFLRNQFEIKNLNLLIQTLKP